MKTYDYIITGGGASGLLTAYRMVKDDFFSGKHILLIEKEEKNSNDRTWCFWEKGAGEWDDILEKSWTQIQFTSDDFTDHLAITPYTYKMLRSASFYEKMISVVKKCQHISFVKEDVKSIYEIKDFAKVVTNKKEYQAKKVLNSILFDHQFLKQKKYPAIQQHFVGWFIQTQNDTFDADSATFMDFSIPQKGNTRFMYILPLSSKVALLEYTLFSTDLLDHKDYEAGIKDYLQTQGITDYKLLEKEQGVIPMTSFPFWNQSSTSILHMGTAGGWSKASTGFTFMNITKKTKHLIDFLKQDKPLDAFYSKNRFWLYDIVLLDILAEYNEKGAAIFTKLFQKNKTQTILQFLDEETSIFQELKIMISMTSPTFVRAFLKRFFS